MFFTCFRIIFSPIPINCFASFFVFLITLNYTSWRIVCSALWHLCLFENCLFVCLCSETSERCLICWHGQSGSSLIEFSEDSKLDPNRIHYSPLNDSATRRKFDWFGCRLVSRRASGVFSVFLFSCRLFSLIRHSKSHLLMLCA